MAEDRMAVLNRVRKATTEGDVDFLREGVRVLAQAVIADPSRRLSRARDHRPGT